MNLPLSQNIDKNIDLKLEFTCIIFQMFQMYLHHPLWLLPLMAVGRGGARKSSHKHRDYQYNDDIEEYYDDDYDYGNIQHDRNNQPPYQMYHDTQQLPKRNKLLIIVLGG